MGRIGQSLIMLGQPPYCSLFSVCQADGQTACVLVWVLMCMCMCMCMRVCVCIHKHARDGTRVPHGKRTPPYLVLPPHPPHHLTSMPLQIGFYITEAVRYEQLIFLSFFLPFLSFIPLSYFLA